VNRLSIVLLLKLSNKIHVVSQSYTVKACCCGLLCYII